MSNPSQASISAMHSAPSDEAWTAYEEARDARAYQYLENLTTRMIFLAGLAIVSAAVSFCMYITH